MKKEKIKKRSKAYRKPLSLHTMTFEQVVDKALKIKR
jgi:hypothetical protein